MVFSSSIFVFLFLPLVMALALVARSSLRNALLFLCSLIFYAWGGLQHVPLLLSLVLTNWLAGLAIGSEKWEAQRKRILTAAITLDLLLLVFFKYTGFLVENLQSLGGLLGLSGSQPSAWQQLALPLGISFFTFHLISYLVDIYRGVATPQRNPLDFALYICFFPQLVAGPIIRYHDVADQLRHRTISVEKSASGIERFILGLSKKLLIANPFGAVADAIFALPQSQLGAATAWLGLIAYVVQLYFDFSGYSDMAIGLGRIFGFEYLENFNYPLISRSISEFWRRWHISLSNWFRDYLYTPLVFAMARRRARRGLRGKVDDRLQLAVVFLVCGIWHGANWTFVIWGVIHGLFLVLERGRLGKWQKSWPAWLGHLYVLSVVLLAWVFFRADSVGQAFSYLRALCFANSQAPIVGNVGLYLSPKITLLFPIALVGFTPLFSWLSRDFRARARQMFGQLAPSGETESDSDYHERFLIWGRPLVHSALLLLSLANLVGQTYNPFIYFRF